MRERIREYGERREPLQNRTCEHWMGWPHTHIQMMELMMVGQVTRSLDHGSRPISSKPIRPPYKMMEWWVDTCQLNQHSTFNDSFQFHPFLTNSWTIRNKLTNSMQCKPPIGHWFTFRIIRAWNMGIIWWWQDLRSTSSLKIAFPFG